MLNLLRTRAWKTGASFGMALSMTTATVLPLVNVLPALANPAPTRTAQVFRGDRIALPQGTEIRIRYEENERIILKPDETSDLTLIVDQDVVSRGGTVVIPEGSRIEGKLRPVGNGTQFVAENLILEGSDRRLPISATSDIVTRRETISRRTNPDYLRGAAVGGAAAAVLAEVLGRIDVGEVLAGAGVGVLAEIFLLRRNRQVEVVVIEPNRDLDLVLEDDFLVQQTRRRWG